LLFFFLRCNPGIENGLFLKVQVVILYLKSFIYFDVEESCRVKRDVGVDVLLIVEAGLEIKYAELAGDLQQFKDILVGLFIF